MLIMGFGPRKPRDCGEVAPAQCPNCGNHVTFHLFEMRNWFRLFFVPIVPGRARHAVICPVCQYGVEITDDALTAARELVELTSANSSGAVDPLAYRGKVDAFWSMLGGERLADPHEANPPAGWYADPFGESEQRYWDGERWTAGTNPPKLRS